MKKTREQLEVIEGLVKRTYNRNGKRLREETIKFSPEDSLGYSFKTEEGDIKTFTVVYPDLGDDKEYTAFRIKMHEYGHVYCNHFDQHEEYDRNVAEALKNYRGQIIDTVNENCGIDFGEKLVERILDDPALNHSLHNIAMDFEVNSKILSSEDVVEMEQDISDLLPDIATERLEALKDSLSDDEMKKKVDDEIRRLSNESKIKLMLPCRYHDKYDIPFPDGLSYGDYLIKIIMNLDQFVKMLVDINKGGMGDTGNVTKDEVQKALGNGMNSLNDLMRGAGMLDDSNDGEEAKEEGDQDGKQSKGLGDHDTSNSGGFKGSNEKTDSKHKGIRKDHMSPSREISDKKRELGEITAGGGFGCGSGGGPEGVRDVRKTDEVDTAIDEVIAKTKSRVIKRQITRNIIRNYNLGKNRSVIAPSIIAKNRIDKRPKIVYIIDISGSMDTELVDRILNSIAKKMKSINRGLKYDILTWSHEFGEWIKDIEPGKPIPKIHTGGGTRMADALRFFAKNYDSSATYIMISDFEDHLAEWCEVINKELPDYTGWGFNYGRGNYKAEWPKCFQVRNFNETYVGRGYYF